MLTNRWSVVLVLGSMLLPLSLSGCRRAVSVAGEDQQAVAEGKQPGEQVVRAKVSKDDRAAPVKEEAGDKEGFQFPGDRGGALLAKVLPPTVPEALRNERRTTPKRTPAPPSLESPTVPLPPAVTMLPSAQLGPKRPLLQPRLVLEEALGDPLELVVPQVQTFVAGNRVKLPSVDLNEPPPLPLLTQQAIPDRASLEDATVETSTSAALAAPLPQRTEMAPFQRLTIPDPYENRRPLPPESMPAESNEPPVSAPQTPRN